jgi:UDP-N-acetylmuramoylalanine--D-glutamate ligase
VVGLARSGQAVARALAERGERVIGCDTGVPEGAAGLAGAGVEVKLDVDGTALLDEVACVVKSPGVPQTAPVVTAARDRGIAIVGELELAWRLVPNPFIAVTGTNGKTTVTELLGHVWRTAGMPEVVAGNVGTPVASLAGSVDAATTVICECSSFQLEDSEALAPECAIFLNFAPDHLDRHPTLDDYLEAKLRIFANQGNDDVAVYNGSDPAVAHRDLGGCARRIAFCRGRPGDPGCDVSLAEGVIFADDQPLVEAGDLALLGDHNTENAMAAAAAALAMGIERQAVAEGLRTFGGVPHRLERVGEVDGVLYVNDSKATNVAAAVAALESFEGGVHAILGGSLKGEAFGLLNEPVIERCVACYLVGDAADQLEHDLGEARSAGIPIRRCDGLADAVAKAVAAAKPGQVVLLTPACASFDAYRDYAERGEHFRSLVKGLGR